MAKRFDVHFQPLAPSEQRSSLKFISFGTGPVLGVKGLQMLINQWAKCMLTPRGTDPTDLNYGTAFTSLHGSNISFVNARDVCVIAVDQCNAQILRMQAKDATLTPTERLASAEIIRFETQPNEPGLAVYVEIKNQAGERLVVPLPAAVFSE